MQFRKMLVHFCKGKGWTLGQLAKTSGVPRATLHGWTTGRSALDLNQVKKVALALEVSLHELIFGEPDPYEVPTDELLKELFTGDVRVSIHRIERKRKRK